MNKNSTKLSTLTQYKDSQVSFSLNFTLNLLPNDSRDYEDRAIVKRQVIILICNIL